MNQRQTVLIADDDYEFVQALKLRCEEVGFAVITADSGIAAISKARKNSPDIIIADVTMPVADGFKVCVRLRELQLAIPVIIVTGKSDDETIRRCQAVGAQYVLKSADMWTKLEPLISELSQSSMRQTASNDDTELPSPDTGNHRKRPLVLAVDDDPHITKALKIRLNFHGIETIEASDGVAGLMIAMRDRPDVVITDYRMPEGSGDYLAVKLKQIKETKSIPVFVLTGQTTGGQADIGLKRDLLGRCQASAFLMKPPDFDELIFELEKYIPVKPIKEFAA